MFITELQAQLIHSVNISPPSSKAISRLAYAPAATLEHNMMTHMHLPGEADEAAELGAEIIKEDWTQSDRELGVCFFPLYQLSKRDIDVFHSGRDIEPQWMY
jgi:hypothetical protein